MPPGRNVRPRKWSNVIDLFDNGWYSAIWGNYDNSNERRLGVRWNGNNSDEPYGYPSQGGNPVWFVEPDILQRQILHTLRNELANIRSNNRRNEYRSNIETALSECE